MADLSEYSTSQQKVIREIVHNDKGFHSTYLIADYPFYGMLGETDNGVSVVKEDVTCSLGTGSTDYTLRIFYSKEQNCWFYELTNLGDVIRGIVRYNTIVNAKSEFAFAILNDNVSDTDLSMSLPYSNVLVLRK